MKQKIGHDCVETVRHGGLAVNGVQACDVDAVSAERDEEAGVVSGGCVCGCGCVGVGVWVWVCGCGCVGVGVWVWVCVCAVASDGECVEIGTRVRGGGGVTLREEWVCWSKTRRAVRQQRWTQSSWGCRRCGRWQLLRLAAWACGGNETGNGL